MKPRPAGGAVAGSKRELGMTPQTGEPPCPGIAKTLASVLAPWAGAAACVCRSQQPFSAFGGPAQFPTRSSPQLGRKQQLIRMPQRVPRAHPCEVKQLVQKNSYEFAAVRKESRIQYDFTPADPRARMNLLAARAAGLQTSAARPQGGKKSDQDGRPGQNRHSPERPLHRAPTSRSYFDG